MTTSRRSRPKRGGWRCSSWGRPSRASSTPTTATSGAPICAASAAPRRAWPGAGPMGPTTHQVPIRFHGLHEVNAGFAGRLVGVKYSFPPVTSPGIVTEVPAADDAQNALSWPPPDLSTPSPRRRVPHTPAERRGRGGLLRPHRGPRGVQATARRSALGLRLSGVVHGRTAGTVGPRDPYADARHPQSPAPGRLRIRTCRYGVGVHVLRAVVMCVQIWVTP